MPFSCSGVGQFGGICIRTKIRRTLPEDLSRLEKLRMGSFGWIFRYDDQRTDDERALKLVCDLRLDYKSRASLEYYESIHRSLNHENIVRFYNSFSARHYRCYLYDLVDGRDLLDAIINFDTYTLLDAKNCIADILKAVRYCHKRDIILRNLHPGCFLWHKTGIETGKVVLIDLEKAVQTFGITFLKFATASKYKYAAPEVIRGNSHKKSADIWACGVIFFNLLTGVFPYNAIEQKQLLEDMDANRRNPIIDELNLPRTTMLAISIMLYANRHHRFTANYALKMCCHTERGVPDCNDIPLDRQRMKTYLANMLRKHIEPSIIQRCAPDFDAAKYLLSNKAEIAILRNGKPMPMSEVGGFIYPQLHGRSALNVFRHCSDEFILENNPDAFRFDDTPQRIKRGNILSLREMSRAPTREHLFLRSLGLALEIQNDAYVASLMRQRDGHDELDVSAFMP